VPCQRCRRRFTELPATPFSGHRFPPDVIGLAVRWYLRFRLTLADVAALLAERGDHVDASTAHAWVGKFAPLCEAVPRAFRLPIGPRWHVDEPDVTIASRWGSAYRAVDEHGPVVDVYVSKRRAAEDAAAFFRRAIEETGVAPTRVTTDRAAAYPPALADVVPGADHETGKLVQQRFERDDGHLKGRLRPTRGFRSLCGARTLCAGQGFVRNLAGGFYRLGCIAGDASLPRAPLLARAWEELTAELLAS
jgi:transposase-like protein